MDPMLKRRDFIRHTGMAGMAAMLPGPILSTSLAPLYTGEIDPGKEFALLKLEKILPGYHFPVIDAHSTEDYHLHFTLYNLYRNFVKLAGSFEISKHSDSDPNFHVESVRSSSTDIIFETDEYRKNFKGSYFFTGDIHAADNMLATPRSWLCRTKIARTRKDPPYLNTGHVWKGWFRNGQIEYESGPYHYTKKAGTGDLTWKWGIINLIQKMAETGQDEIHFSALDEMDMVYEHQYARYRKTKTMDCGVREVDFKVYDVLGDCIIPTVYWVDGLNRVVFIVTGTEAFVLA
jgi:hypothetical protein